MPAIPSASRVWKARSRACPLVASLAGVLAVTSAQALPAFPGAQGIGANASGGARNAGQTPTIYHVTNLNDSGAGSFRDAVSKGNRIVVFDAGGYVNLVPGSAVSAASDLTIAGETAPGGGIAIVGAEVSFSKRSNVICRNIRFRQSSLDPNKGKSGIGMDGGKNIIMDHISVEFGKWDNIDCNGSDNITFQNIIDADPIGQQFNAHADSAVTWYRNLWASAHNRNPLAKGNIEYVNNVLYNFQSGLTAHTGGKFSMDIVNNCFVCGPSGKPGTPFFQIGGNISIYGAGNYEDTDRNGVLNGRSIGVPGGHPLPSPWNPSVTGSLPTLSAVDACAYVVSTVGATPWDRDPVDAQVINDVHSLGRQGHMWKSEKESGLPNGGLGTIAPGAPLPDGDRDGMPDFWEAAMTGGASTTSLDPLATAPSGYLNIEDYLHFMAEPHAITMRNRPVTVDLKPLAAGFANQSFTVSAATHGMVSLAADGHSAQFAPASNFVGLGSFQFSLPYQDGALATFTVGVCVSTAAL
jgi:pectate lyase